MLIHEPFKKYKCPFSYVVYLGHVACLNGVGAGFGMEGVSPAGTQGYICGICQFLLGEAGMLCAVELGAQKSQFFVIDFLGGSHHFISVHQAL